MSRRGRKVEGKKEVAEGLKEGRKIEKEEDKDWKRVLVWWVQRADRTVYFNLE